MIMCRLLASVVVACIGSSAAAEAMSFRTVSNGGNMYSCCWIVADGEITDRTPSDYLEFVEGETSLPSEIRITGFGTDYAAAIELGRTIRDHGLRVTVGRSEQYYDPWWERFDDGACRDACVLVLLGGRERSVPMGTEVSVSQFHDTSLQAALSGGELSGTNAIRRRIERQAATGSIVQFIVDMGVDPRFYTIATAVELDSSGRALTPEEIVELNIDNSGDIAGPWRAEPFGNGFFSIADTRHSARSLMLYCVGDVSYVGFSFPRLDREARLRELLARDGDQVVISSGTAIGEGRLQDFFRSEDGRMFVSFRIGRQTADLIAGAERLEVRTPGSLPRAHLVDLAIAFDFRDIRGNPELPRRVLQVCST